MLLRPHHALCIGFFEGRGYSAEFVRHMTGVIARLDAENPGVTLVTRCDTLCGACPHNIGGICGSAEKVRGYDEAVLMLCGLSAGDTLQWQTLRSLVTARILRAGKRETVCGGCMWNAVCAAKEDA